MKEGRKKGQERKGTEEKERNGREGKERKRRKGRKERTERKELDRRMGGRIDGRIQEWKEG